MKRILPFLCVTIPGCDPDLLESRWTGVCSTADPLRVVLLFDDPDRGDDLVTPNVTVAQASMSEPAIELRCPDIPAKNASDVLFGPCSPFDLSIDARVEPADPTLKLVGTCTAGDEVGDLELWGAP